MTGGTDARRDDETPIDVAVIGAGIGGAYTAWRLRDRGLSISVFEGLDRIGGKLLSVPLPVAPGSYVELGAMRFDPSIHRILNKTICEMGLKVIDFPVPFYNPDEMLWYVRGKHIFSKDFGTENMPYTLDPADMKYPQNLKSDILERHVNVSNIGRLTADEKYSLVTDDGTPLYKMSVDNFLGKYASREVYHYISEISAKEMTVGRMNALFDWNRAETENYKTVDGGMDRVPKELIRRFLETSTHHKLNLNVKLESIEKHGDNYQLSFRKTATTDGITEVTTSRQTVCVKKVVLALDKQAVENIHFSAFSDNPGIMKNLNSVMDHPAGKIYLAYKTKWWKTNNTRVKETVTDLPNRQTYDWLSGTNGISIIMASYHDGKMVDYWRELSQLGTPIPGSLPGAYAVTDVVKERLERYLSAIFNYRQEDIPEAVGGGMLLWSSAWNFYKPGFDSRKVRELMYKPSPSDDVYLVGSSWQFFSGWVESSMESVDDVINKYFSQTM